MAHTDFQSIDDYLATKPPEVKATLQRVREVIRRAVPGATELISYQMPAVRLPQGIVLFFAAWKEHWSLYPATPLLVKTLKVELAPYELSKGTIRFPLSKRVPVRLISRIAKVRAAEVLAKKKSS